MTNLSQDLLQELFDYKDGQLITKFNRPSNPKGMAIGCIDKTTGYVRTMVQGTNYRCHRLIWNWHNGDIPQGLVIDHINCNKADNRIENLRLVTLSENQFNRKNNNKGYFWDKSKSKYKARIGFNNKIKHIGSFHTEQEAHQAYLNAKKELHIIQQH
jgi:hypothetical protein